MALSDGLKYEYKQAVLKAVRYHFPEARITLFGSRARGDFAAGADIDIVIDLGKPIDPGELVRLKATLENLTIPLMVDVVDWHYASPELKEIIKREGIVWKDRVHAKHLYAS